MAELQEIKLSDGRVVKLGYKPRPPGFAFSSSVKLVELPDIPESMWTEFDARGVVGYPVKIGDQDGIGACTHFASAKALELIRWTRGYPHVELSPFFGYANSVDGYDVGSSVSEAGDAMATVGYCRNDMVPYGTIRKRDIPAAAYENAKRYRAEFTLGKFRNRDGDNGWRDMCVAVQLRRPIVFTVHVDGGFDSFDPYGVPQNGPGTHNHAVYGGFAMLRTRAGEWVIPAGNHWTTKWGNRGYFNAARRTIRGTYRDGFTILEVRVTADENPPPIPG